MQTSDQHNTAGPNLRRIVRVAWAQVGSDFNDMLQEGLGSDIARRIEDARPMQPFAVAESTAAKPRTKASRARPATCRRRWY